MYKVLYLGYDHNRVKIRVCRDSTTICFYYGGIYRTPIDLVGFQRDGKLSWSEWVEIHWSLRCRSKVIDFVGLRR